MKAFRIVRKDNGRSNPHTGLVGEYHSLTTALSARGNLHGPLQIQRFDGTEWRNCNCGSEAELAGEIAYQEWLA